MSEACQVFTAITLQRKVRAWDELSNAEFSFFRDLLAEHGVAAISGNPKMCAVEEEAKHDLGTRKHTDFWLKIRGEWTPLTLEVRHPGVFILHEQIPDPGP